MSAVETAQRKPFPQELTQKPDQIRTALDFDVATANLIRYVLEDYEAKEFGALFFRSHKIDCPLGVYNFGGSSKTMFPIKGVDLEQIPRPLWDFLNDGYFRRGEPLYFTAAYEAGLNTHTSIMAISDSAPGTGPRQIKARVINLHDLQFTKGMREWNKYAHQALTIAQQMVDLGYEAADHCKVSMLSTC